MKYLVLIAADENRTSFALADQAFAHMENNIPLFEHDGALYAFNNSDGNTIAYAEKPAFAFVDGKNGVIADVSDPAVEYGMHVVMPAASSDAGKGASDRDLATGADASAPQPVPVSQTGSGPEPAGTPATSSSTD